MFRPRWHLAFFVPTLEALVVVVDPPLALPVALLVLGWALPLVFAALDLPT